MQSNKRWTLLELLNTTTKYFTEKNIDNPRLNTEELLSKTLELDRVQLYVAYERPLTDAEIDTFRSLVKRRIQHEPLQHILGITEFMGYPIKVNRDVLIPRPETEILVEEVLKLKSEIGMKNPYILDIGTGSGCIAISLAMDWPTSSILAIDISTAALDMAKQNCELNNIDVQIADIYHKQNTELTSSVILVEHDVLKSWPSLFSKQFDIIVSNPPYVKNDEIEALQPEVRDFEPHIALTDSGDGLKFYKHIFDLVKVNCELECKYLFLEMSGSQPKEITDLAYTYSFKKIETIPDLNKIDRVLKIEV
jgi:release factor glutamine methyltransferase